MPLSLHKAVQRSLLLTFAVVALGAWSAPARASTTLTVVLPDEERRTVDLATDLGQPDTRTTYLVRRQKGTAHDRQFVEGYSLSQVFATIGATRGFKEVKLGADGEITVSENQLNDVPPPALYIENGNVMFIRNSFGAKDVNAYQNIQVSDTDVVQGSESSLKLHVGRKREVDAGEKLEFVVNTSGGGAGKQYGFEWDFDDGDVAKGNDVKHEFAETGTYDVTVTATTRDGEGDTLEEAQAHVRVNVGEPERKSETDRSGGGTNTAGGAPSSGTYDGSPGAGSSTGGSTPPTTPYSPSTPSPDPFDNVTTDNDPPATDTGDQVSGALLANLDAPPNDATASAARAARTGNPDFQVPEPDDSVSPAAWAGLGALIFMGMGAGLESGRRPRIRRRGLGFPVARR
jgi:PKD domain